MCIYIRNLNLCSLINTTGLFPPVCPVQSLQLVMGNLPSTTALLVHNFRRMLTRPNSICRWQCPKMLQEAFWHGWIDSKWNLSWLKGNCLFLGIGFTSPENVSVGSTIRNSWVVIYLGPLQTHAKLLGFPCWYTSALVRRKSVHSDRRSPLNPVVARPERSSGCFNP